MAKKKKTTQKKRPQSVSTTIERKVKIEVEEARFEPFAALSYLDVERLKKAGRVRIELGTVDGGCSGRTVYGVVEKGMLVAIEFEGCKDKDARCGDLELGELIEQVRKPLGTTQAATRKLPLEMSELIANPGIVIETWTCYRICIWGFCFTCCFGENPLGTYTICSFGR